MPRTLGLLLALSLTGCPVTDRLVVEIGVFIEGAPNGAAVTAQAPAVTTATTTWTPGSTYHWHVDLTPITEMTVDDVVIDVPDLGGHFVVPLEDAEIAAGAVDIPMFVSQEAGEPICQRDYRGVGTCYTPMTEGTTDMTFSAGMEPAPADPQTGIGMSAGTPVQVAMAPPPPPDLACGDTWMPADCACQVDACCNATQCYYHVDGSTWFACNGEDCTGTIDAVAAFCGCDFMP